MSRNYNILSAPEDFGDLKQRYCFFDTETTGLSPEEGHRVIEIGAVEVADRKLTGRKFQARVNPERGIDAAAQEIHGLSEADLADSPLFADIAAEFLEFLGDAPLVAHNAIFDIHFLNAEFTRLQQAHAFPGTRLILDTLPLARQAFKGRSHSLDALIAYYKLQGEENRDLHGALKDSRLLAKVWLAMTGGQSSLGLEPVAAHYGGKALGRSAHKAQIVVTTTPAEQAAHAASLEKMRARCGDKGIVYDRF